MTNVPIVSVEIDDSQFRQFQDRFAQFGKTVENSAEAWKLTDEQVEKLRAHFDAMRASAAEQNESAGDAEKKTRGSRASIASYLTDVRAAQNFAATFSKNIHGTTKNLASWTKHAVTLTAVFEYGGRYGLGSVMGGAFDRRYRANGLGISTGALASAEVNFGQLGDVGGVLSGLNRASNDVIAQQPLWSLGINPRGKNADQLLPETIAAVKALVDRTDPRTFNSSLQAYNLDQIGFTPQMLRVLRSMSGEKVESLRKGFGRDKSGLDIPDDVGRKWTELSNILTRSEVQLQTALAEPLTKITPGLIDLSKSFVRLLGKMLDQPEIKTWIDGAASGVTKFADEIGSPHAQHMFAEFLHSFEMTGRDFDRLNSWLRDHAATIAAGYGAYRGFMLGRRFGPYGGLTGAALGAFAGAAAVLPEDQKARIIARNDALHGVRDHHLKRGVISQTLGLSKPAGNDALWARSRHGQNAIKLDADPYYKPSLKSAGHAATGPLPTGAVAGDISGEATYRRRGEHVDPAAFIVHHTGGRGTPEGVVSTLNSRGLGVQYVMDRDGKVYRTLPDGSRGAHIVPGDVNGLHLSNDNTIGMEVIAKDDSDVTPEEIRSGVAFYKQLQKRYPGLQVYGHGYVNPGHKMASEGKSIVDAIHAAENKPADPARDPLKVMRDSARGVPVEKRGFLGSYAGRDDPKTILKGPHLSVLSDPLPNSTKTGGLVGLRRRAAQSTSPNVVVHDATGGAVQVTTGP